MKIHSCIDFFTQNKIKKAKSQHKYLTILQSRFVARANSLLIIQFQLGQKFQTIAESNFHKILQVFF